MEQTSIVLIGCTAAIIISLGGWEAFWRFALTAGALLVVGFALVGGGFLSLR